MVITDVRVQLADQGRNQQYAPSDILLAYCSVTVDDCLVIREMKIVKGGHQGIFVSFPTKKLQDRCLGCDHKNDLTSRHCSYCGAQLGSNRAKPGKDGKIKHHIDLAYPINRQARSYFHNTILQAYYEEVEKAKSPGYKSRYDLNLG